MAGKAVIERRRRVFDDFFKIDELAVRHERTDGAMSAVRSSLVFERGDSVAVLLFDAQRRCVILVGQFRVPVLVGRRRDDSSTTDGWLVETVAGMIDANETPETTAIRETFEETGYRVRDLQLIGRFFVSPGGASERLFLYFAKVSDSDRLGTGGGIDDEDIKIVWMPLNDLFDQLARGAIEDAKLAIAAFWLLSRAAAIS
jgi:nudix-type nucleoside diphosphatase (YffH/AdpP family)